MKREDIFKINSDNKEIIITLDKNLYELDTIYTTSYVFLEKAYILLKSNDKDYFIILKIKNGNDDLEYIANEFCNQLINYSFQLEMSKKNLNTKKEILEQIYSSTPEDNNVSEDAEIEDPDGILIPWEDKYGKNE